MPVTVAAASTLEDERLAALFTAVYAGYWHPIEIDAAGLRRMVAAYDLDLDASVVACEDDRPIGVAMLGVRGSEGWVGGMGVLPGHRGAGVGTTITSALLDSARARGLRRVRLEVLEQNAPAISIYRELGFRDLRDVAVWRLDAPPLAGTSAAEADVDEVIAELAATDDAPWQRSVATIVRSRAAGTELAAVRADGGSALFAANGTQAALQAIVAPHVRRRRGPPRGSLRTRRIVAPLSQRPGRRPGR